MPTSVPGSAPKYRHVVVIGGSMAGLVSARVLSDHFEKVTLLERDPLPDSPDARKGVPQARHLHGLLKRGANVLTGLFPDLYQGLLTAGAEELEFGPDLAWYQFGGWMGRTPTGIKGVFLSRGLLEQEVRRRVRAVPNIQVLESVDALGLSTSADRQRVQGVTIRRGGGGEETLDADLVVDASGRGSRVPAWLEAMGRSKVKESAIKVDVGYASRLVKQPPESPGWKVLAVIASSPGKRQGVIAPVEGGKWIVSLVGMLGDHPPTDEAGWREFSRKLPVQDVAEMIEKTTPVSDITFYKFPAHLRHHYEQMPDFPDGLAVLGDAHCSFNPMYGQGITTSALSAVMLGEHLGQARAASSAGLPPGFSRAYQQAIAKEMNDPWAMSTGEDMRHPEVEGVRPFGTGALLWYVKRFIQVANTDDDACRLFYQMMNMMAPPTATMAPAMAWKILKGPPSPPSPARGPVSQARGA